MSSSYHIFRFSIIVAMFAYMSANAQDDIELGRLFTDPKTRLELNQARERQEYGPVSSITADTPAQPLLLPEVALNGMIIRGDGSADFWINNVSSLKNQEIKRELNTHRLKDSSVRVSLPGGETITLKPGQVYSLDTAKVREAYESLPEELPEAEVPKEDIETVEVEEEPEEFDESKLAEEAEIKIKLLEERIEKLEKTQTTN